MGEIQSGSMEDLPEPLTEREREILVCLSEGLSNREIANRLYLSTKTVRWYNSQIYSKLRVHDRKAALEVTEALGLLKPGPGDTAAPTLKHNLPNRITPFVGRQSELTALTHLLSQPDIRLVTILAPGGMGKTRLGLAAAEQMLSHFADGVFLVSLAALSSPDHIVPAIAEQVGFSFGSCKEQVQEEVNSE